jgi:hypothetical protein
MRLPIYQVLIALAVSGCNGQLYHGPAGSVDEPFNATDASKNVDEPGIVYFPRVPVLKTSTTTKLNKDTGKCDRATTYDIVTVADTTNPQKLYYQAAWLETYKFSATLAADGTLLTVGTESTPDQGNTFKNVAGGISSLATAASGLGALSVIDPKIKALLDKAAVTCTEGTAVTFGRFDLKNLPSTQLPK